MIVGKYKVRCMNIKPANLKEKKKEEEYKKDNSVEKMTLVANLWSLRPDLEKKKEEDAK